MKRASMTCLLRIHETERSDWRLPTFSQFPHIRICIKNKHYESGGVTRVLRLVAINITAGAKKMSSD